MSLDRKVIDIIVDNCNKKLKAKHSAQGDNTIQDWMVELIIKEFFKELLKDEKPPERAEQT